MCGLAGFLGGELFADAAAPEHTLETMAQTILHRGPDSGGIWHDTKARVALAHRRLSIIDPSPAGHQPMISSSGRYVIVFNGEIYNHTDLRTQLSCAWRGHSDTETLLAGFDCWGIAETIKRTIGMFVFAVWDRNERLLVLGRDRIGEKPLYYGWQGTGEKRTFLFGSELKALRAHPSFVPQVDRNALTLFMRHACVPSPYAIYEDIHKLPPASLLTVSLQHQKISVETYWSGAAVATSGVAAPFAGTDTQAVDALETLLKDAVRKQMMADVPLGAFLSGGVDSSAIVALMQSQSTQRIKTFSIGFHEAAYNEATHAAAVAKHLGTEHTELYVTPTEAMDVVQKLPQLYDEPFGDSSQIPTFLLAQMTRKHVTVSLSGDGGDELFGGYNRYAFASRMWNIIGRIPQPLRKLISRGLTSLPPSVYDRLPGLPLNAGDKIHKGADALACQNISELYMALVSQWPKPSALVIGGQEPATLLTQNRPALPGLNDIEKMMAMDMLTYLPDDILTKVDRAAMGVSLETRMPFLDHRVVEFAWSLPLSCKLREGHTKWALRQVLYRHVPESLIERPKMGFGVPIGQWLRHDMRDWAEDLLDETRLSREGYLNTASIRKKWEEHISGKRNWQYPLWNVLMFQLWHAESKL